MLLTRSLVTLLLLPVILAAIYFGGFLYIGLVCFILGAAAWEYVVMFRAGGHQPAGVFVVGGVIAIALARGTALDHATPTGFGGGDMLLSLLTLLSMAYHLITYERGRDHAGSDLAVTLGGIVYLGWIGAYLISLRRLPEGQWWLMVTLLAVWLADSGAYMVGSQIGKHKMSPRLSPHKSWEGFFGGILFSLIFTPLLALPLPTTTITSWHVILLSLVVSLLTPLGDLGESMFKRQFGFKDSGKLLPGHGGAFDRIDSWLWAAVLSYYVVTLIFRIPGG